MDTDRKVNLLDWMLEERGVVVVVVYEKTCLF